MNTTRLSIFTRSKALGRRLSAFLGLLPLLGLSFMSCSNDIESPPLPEIPVKKLPPLNVSDSLALVKIYKQCGPWDTEWDLKDITTWTGVKVALNETTKELRVVGFEDHDGSFRGEFPKEFCQLTELRTLAVSGGFMHGKIPEEIGNLKHLYYLCIQDNRMDGEIPRSIGKLTNLYELALGFNRLSGSIPEEIGNLANLEYLKINETDISGEIPKTIGKLKKLKYANLMNNKLSGAFPAEAIQHQFQFVCENNNIESFPFEFWKDDNPNYPPVLKRNCLSGEIPEWVFKTEKWKKFANSFLIPQKKNYGYSNYHD
jgi:Leucine-rich repeat (LRR) protein